MRRYKSPRRRRYKPKFVEMKEPRLVKPSWAERPIDNVPSHESTGLSYAQRVDNPQYTGTLIKGIAVMHKSNSVPVINNEDAIHIAKMRRN